MPSLTERILDVESESSWASRARRKRWRWFANVFPDLSEMTVIDLGGTVKSWHYAPVRPREVVVLNFDANENPASGECAHWTRVLVGDACDPPAELDGEQFDLVYSNSVLEHVGGYARRRAFAESVHRLGDRHWIQTPYRYFPLEPHFLFPGFQQLPLRARAHAMRRWPIGHFAGVTRIDDAVRYALEVELLSATEMHHLFPSSRLERERVLGLTKSLIAVK